MLSTLHQSPKTPLYLLSLIPSAEQKTFSTLQKIIDFFFYQDLFSVSLLTNFPPSIYLVVFPSWNIVVCSLMVAYLWIPSFHGQAPKKEFVVLSSSPSIYFFKPVLSGFEFLQKQTLRQGYKCKQILWKLIAGNTLGVEESKMRKRRMLIHSM